MKAPLNRGRLFKRQFNRNKLMRITILLLLMSMLSISLLPGLVARFKSDADAADTSSVAAFVLDLNDTDSHIIDISGITKPGDSKTYNFAVTNKKGSVISEVAESYTITMQVNGSMPLVCTIGDASNNKVLKPELNKNSTDKDSGTTTAATFQASTDKSDSYTLTVKWDENDNDPKYASGSAVAEVILTVQCNQTD
jgi:hypothetical protein